MYSLGLLRPMDTEVTLNDTENHTLNEMRRINKHACYKTGVQIDTHQRAIKFKLPTSNVQFMFPFWYEFVVHVTVLGLKIFRPV